MIIALDILKLIQLELFIFILLFTVTLILIIKIQKLLNNKRKN
ncbi:MAG: hypothetical protein V8R81_00510 [Clostridia bacterium]